MLMFARAFNRLFCWIYKAHNFFLRSRPFLGSGMALASQGSSFLIIRDTANLLPGHLYLPNILLFHIELTFLKDVITFLNEVGEW